MRVVDADALIKELENIDLYKEDKVGKFGVLKSILVVEKMAYEIPDGSVKKWHIKFPITMSKKRNN